MLFFYPIYSVPSIIFSVPAQTNSQLPHPGLTDLKSKFADTSGITDV